MIDDEDLFAQLKAWFREDHDAAATWHAEAIEDFAFVAGDQWEAGAKESLAEQARPCLTFNRIHPTVELIVGMEVGNRQEVRYIPRTIATDAAGLSIPGADDAGPAELLTAAAAYFRDGANAEFEESDAYRDAVICGMGWTETRIDYDRDPDGAIAIDHVDPGEMLWDAKAMKRNLADARRRWRVKAIDAEAARALFPGRSDAELHADWAHWRASGDENPVDRDLARLYPRERDGAAQSDRRECVLIEAEWIEIETWRRIIDPQTGETRLLSPGDYEKLAADLSLMGAPPLLAAKAPKRVYRRALLGGALLESGLSQSQAGFKYQCITGYRDRNRRRFFGLARLMRDPQKYANAFASSILHTILTSGKGILAERDAFEDVQRAEEEWSRADKIVWVNPGALSQGRIQPKPLSPHHPATPELMAYANTAMRETTGINIEILGLADRQQAASLESQRRQAGATILAGLFDGLRRYRKEQGRVLLDLIREYCSDRRLIRIAGPTGEIYAPLIRQPAILQFDIIVDEAPNSPNQKELTWRILQEVMPLLMRLGLPAEAWRAIVRQSPLPATFAAEFFKAIESEAGKPAAPPPEMLERQARLQLDEKKIEYDHHAKMAEIAARVGPGGAPTAALTREFEQALGLLLRQNAAILARLDQGAVGTVDTPSPNPLPQGGEGQ